MAKGQERVPRSSLVVKVKVEQAELEAAFATFLRTEGDDLSEYFPSAAREIVQDSMDRKLIEYAAAMARVLLTPEPRAKRGK